jgi:membrane-bound serine protease (ClpP class)
MFDDYRRSVRFIRQLFLCFFLLAGFAIAASAQPQAVPPPDPSGREFVAIIDMDMPILPGTAEFLEASIEDAHNDGARLLVVVLDTPGGMLHTSQEMIQTIFAAPIPVVFFVYPAGSSATSAGVFITLAGHVAAMSPGTTIGAAHPVLGDGSDIQGDLRAKAENMTVAMVKSIAEQRGRNVEWAEQAVKESSSITEQEALRKGVVDLVAEDLDDLLRQIKGKEVRVDNVRVTLEDYSKLPRRELASSFKHRTLNVLANPNIAALLWLGATTGLALELYNPGAILPGVVGLICLLLALAVSQVIPVTQTGVLLLVAGALLIAAELFVPSGILGIGGVIAIVFGAIYLIDVSLAPDLTVNLQFLVPMALLLGLALLQVVRLLIRSAQRRVATGEEGLIGLTGTALETITTTGKVFVNGEIWNAEISHGLIQKNSEIEVVAVKKGLTLEVKEAVSKSERNEEIEK